MLPTHPVEKYPSLCNVSQSQVIWIIPWNNQNYGCISQKKSSPCHLYSLNNINSPASVCMIWIPRIIQRTIIQVLLDRWYETLHINIKHVIVRLRFVVNNVQIIILWRKIPTCLWQILHLSLLLVMAPNHWYVTAVTVSSNKMVTTYLIFSKENWWPNFRF